LRRKTVGIVPPPPKIDHEEVVSLSDILSDGSLFHAHHEYKQITKQDFTLVPLPSAPAVVRARRGNAVRFAIFYVDSLFLRNNIVILTDFFLHSHANLRYGFAESAGVRPTNEDTMSIVPKMRNPETFFCAVFDGHGGEMVSRELKARFHKVSAKMLLFCLQSHAYKVECH